MIISAKEVYEIKDQTIILPFSSHKDANGHGPDFLPGLFTHLLLRTFSLIQRSEYEVS